MRIGLVGDMHGSTKDVEYILDRMGERKISHVFFLGDFGLWENFDGVQYLDDVQASAHKNNLSVLVVPGNHDSYDMLEAFSKYSSTHKGFYYFRSRVLVSPKVNTFKLANRVFGIAGGAVSVDREWRKEYNSGRYYDAMRGKYIRIKDPVKIWWEQETLTDDEVMEAKSFGKVDYLLTHDASNHTPWQRRLKPDWESQHHRQKIDAIIESTEPDFHFHGHFHEKYDWGRYINDGHWVQTYGFEADHSAMHRVDVTPAAWNWGILDTSTNEFFFRGEGMTFRSLESNE